MANISTLGGHGRGAPVADVSTLAAESARPGVDRPTERFDAHFARALGGQDRQEASRSKRADDGSPLDRTHRASDAGIGQPPVERRVGTRSGDGPVSPSDERGTRSDVRLQQRRGGQEPSDRGTAIDDVSVATDTSSGSDVGAPPDECASASTSDPVDASTVVATGVLATATLVLPPPETVAPLGAPVATFVAVAVDGHGAGEGPGAGDPSLSTSMAVAVEGLDAVGGLGAIEGPPPGGVTSLVDGAPDGDALVESGAPAAVTPPAPHTDTATGGPSGATSSDQSPVAGTTVPSMVQGALEAPSSVGPAVAQTIGTSDVTTTPPQSDTGAEPSVTAVGLPAARASQVRTHTNDPATFSGAMASVAAAAAMSAAPGGDGTAGDAAASTDPAPTASNPGDLAVISEPGVASPGVGLDHRGGHSGFADSVRAAATEATHDVGHDAGHDAGSSAPATASRPQREADLLRTPGLDRMSIDLSDEGLGPLTLQASNGIGGLQLRLTAGERAIGDALAASAHLLREELEASGTRLGSLDVGHRDARRDAHAGTGGGRQRDAIDRVGSVGDDRALARSLAAATRPRPTVDGTGGLDLLI